MAGRETPVAHEFAFTRAFVEFIEHHQSGLEVVVGNEGAFEIDVEAERRTAMPLAKRTTGDNTLSGVLTFDFGFEFSERRGDCEKFLRVRVALLQVEVDTHVKGVASDTTLIDNTLDDDGEILD